MTKKSVLQLMELLMMVLVFALSACICVRCFVHADQLSRQQEQKTQAMLVAQNAAELLKAENGSLEKAAAQMGGSCRENSWCLLLDASWEPGQDADSAECMLLVTRQDAGQLPMGKALVQVLRNDTVLVELQVAWQEERI